MKINEITHNEQDTLDLLKFQNAVNRRINALAAALNAISANPTKDQLKLLCYEFQHLQDILGAHKDSFEYTILNDLLTKLYDLGGGPYLDLTENINV